MHFYALDLSPCLGIGEWALAKICTDRFRMNLCKLERDVLR